MVLSHHKVMDFLLYHACGGLSEEEAEKKYGDRAINRYSVELHCCGFVVVAKSLGGGKYEILEIENCNVGDSLV